MLKWMYRTALLFALVGLVACGDSEDGNKANNANNTNNTNNTNNANNTNNVDNTGKMYAADYQLRFDSLAFDRDSPGFLVNGILATNFDQSLDFPVIVLVDIANIDASAGTLDLRGGSGLKSTTDGEYVWEDGQSEMYSPGTLDPTTGAFQGVLPNLDFVATLVTETDTQKVIIPIQKLNFSGNLELSEDGNQGSIPAGELEGYITKEDGDMTLISLIPGGTPVSITDVFKESALNYDSATEAIVEEGTGDAWFVYGTFSAVPTTIQ